MDGNQIKSNVLRLFLPPIYFPSFSVQLYFVCIVRLISFHRELKYNAIASLAFQKNDFEKQTSTKLIGDKVKASAFLASPDIEMSSLLCLLSNLFYYVSHIHVCLFSTTSLLAKTLILPAKKPKINRLNVKISKQNHKRVQSLKRTFISMHTLKRKEPTHTLASNVKVDMFNRNLINKFHCQHFKKRHLKPYIIRQLSADCYVNAFATHKQYLLLSLNHLNAGSLRKGQSSCICTLFEYQIVFRVNFTINRNYNK